MRARVFPLIPVLPVPLPLSPGLNSLATGIACRVGSGKGGKSGEWSGGSLKFGSSRWRGEKELIY